MFIVYNLVVTKMVSGEDISISRFICTGVVICVKLNKRKIVFISGSMSIHLTS